MPLFIPYDNVEQRCPHCKKRKRLPAFGIRIIDNIPRLQSWCRACRAKSGRWSKGQQVVGV